MSKCSFCGKDLEKGRGKMYVKVDATIHYFCSMKCEKNLIHLKRTPRKVPWTTTGAAEKDKRRGGK
tara:strand:- start:357 stop:554 length:198 start_codon:yes stop_codon:yes gene_type:complete